MDLAIDVEISDTQDHLRVDPAALDKLTRFVLGALLRTRASISIALVDNAAIHALNRQHLGHDWPTDVISFPLGEPGDPVLTGELVVSTEMACASASELGVNPHDELALYVVHGLLHLCGFDDHDDGDRRQMRQLEDELLTRAGLTNPYSWVTAIRPESRDADEALAQSQPRDQGEAALSCAGHEWEARPWTA